RVSGLHRGSHRVGNLVEAQASQDFVEARMITDLVKERRHAYVRRREAARGALVRRTLEIIQRALAISDPEIGKRHVRPGGPTFLASVLELRGQLPPS